MLIVMDKKATQAQIMAVVAAVEARGYTARPIPGGERVTIGVLYNKGAVDVSLFLGYPGVKDVQAGQPGVSARRHARPRR
jgi:3-deoxy-7-phosphoheptulonate synthase